MHSGMLVIFLCNFFLPKGCHKSLVIVLVGRQTRDGIGCLSVKPPCYWLQTVFKSPMAKLWMTKFITEPQHFTCFLELAFFTCANLEYAFFLPFPTLAPLLLSPTQQDESSFHHL